MQEFSSGTILGFSAGAKGGVFFSTVYVKKLNNDTTLRKFRLIARASGDFFFLFFLGEKRGGRYISFFFFFLQRLSKAKISGKKEVLVRCWLGVRMSRRPLLPFPQVGSAKEY